MRPLLALLFPLALMGCGMPAEAACFPAGVPAPGLAAVRQAAVGQSARELGEALLERDLDRAAALLRADPALARVDLGEGRDMLLLAVASCKPTAIELLLRSGAPADGVDGEGRPVRLALAAYDPALAHALLSGGASPTPAEAPLEPFREAIARDSLGAVRLLLDFRADPDVALRTGRRPLHVALDMERFRIAELLIDRGADPFALDVGGANLGAALHAPLLNAGAEDRAARERLLRRLPELGWPDPAPTAAEAKRLAEAGRWPPAR